MKQWLRILESSLLTLCGVGILYFALSEHYGLLMKESFRWLSLTGAALMLILGLCSFTSSQQRSGSNSLTFLVMLLLVALGQPHLPSAQMIQPPSATIEAGLWKQVDLEQFPRMELKDLATKDTETIYRSGESFTTIGIVKKLEALEAEQSFAIMINMMYCCLADSIAVGFRVPSDERDTLTEGQWVMVSGQLQEEPKALDLPNFRFERSMMSSVHKSYYLQPAKIMSYSHQAQLPLLSTSIKEGQNQRFAQILQQTTHLESLGSDTPYTVFLPVDKAIELLNAPAVDEMSHAELEAFAATHIVSGIFTSDELNHLDAVTNVGGHTVPVALQNGKLTIGNSRILMKNLQTRNGIIHFIYPPLSPPTEELE